MLRSCADVVARCGSNCDLRLVFHLFKVACTCENTHTFVVKSECVCSSVNTTAVFLTVSQSYSNGAKSQCVSPLLSVNSL